MAISFTNLGASTTPDIASTSNVATYATASWSPPATAGVLLCGWIGNSHLSAAPTPSGLTGNGITWTQIATHITASGTSRITLYGAHASGATTGATTAAFGGVSSTGCWLAFFQADGTDVAAGVVQTFIQAPTATGTGTSGSVSLAAPASSNNRPISGWMHGTEEATAPRASWTELDEMTYASPARRGETQYRGDAFEQTASATWTTSSAWVGIAAELKELAAAPKSLVVQRVPRRRQLQRF